MGEIAKWESGKVEVMHKLAKFIIELQKYQPKIQGRRELYLIDPSEILPRLDEDLAEVKLTLTPESTFTIDYSLGYPTVEGLPIWDRLPTELDDYYKLFRAFKEYRPIHGAEIYKHMSEMFQVSTKQLLLLSKIYNWDYRYAELEAYNELQKQILFKRQQEEVLERHKYYSESMLDTLMTMVTDPQYLMRVKPENIVNFVKLAMEMERLSAGLEKGSTKSESKGGTQQNLPPINVNNFIDARTGETNLEVVNEDSSKPTKSKSEAETIEDMLEIAKILDEIGAFREEATEVECTEVEKKEQEEAERLEQAKNAVRTATKNKYEERKEVYNNKIKANSRGKKVKIKKLGDKDE